MVLVNRLDVCGHLLRPGGEGSRRAGWAARKVSSTIGTAARLVTYEKWLAAEFEVKAV